MKIIKWKRVSTKDEDEKETVLFILFVYGVKCSKSIDDCNEECCCTLRMSRSKAFASSLVWNVNAHINKQRQGRHHQTN